MFHLQPLERRRLMSVTVTQDTPGYYTLTGGEYGDVIALSIDQSAGTFTFNNTTYSGVENILILGGPGSDEIIVSSTGTGSIGTSIYGNTGHDHISLNSAGAIWGGYGNDVIYLSDSFHGEVYGEGGADTIYVSGNTSSAEIQGGDGDDLIDCSGNNAPVVVRGGAGNDTLIGSAYDDVLYGDAGTDSVSGGAGNDAFFSSEIIHGDDGYDVLYASSGQTGVYDGIEEIVYG